MIRVVQRSIAGASAASPRDGPSGRRRRSPLLPRRSSADADASETTTTAGSATEPPATSSAIRSGITTATPQGLGCAGTRTVSDWEAFELSDENLQQLYCPIGFAHAFCVTSELADVIYKCSAYYDEGLERGIAYDDPDVAIEWPALELSASPRDAAAPLLRDVAAELPFEYPS